MVCGPMANAWFSQTGLEASSVAPAGRSKVSPCQCRVMGSASKGLRQLSRPASVSAIGAKPISFALLG